MLSQLSTALTVMLSGWPTVLVFAERLMVKCPPKPALTLIGILVPVTEPLTVSVAVRVWLPTVISLAGNVPTPLASPLGLGKATHPFASELLNVMVPA